MIKWCSYCVRFLCECEPYDDCMISHGVCQACYQKALASGAPDKKSFQELKDFFRSMQLIAHSGNPAEVHSIIEESRRLHIPPMDLLLGILQPLLVEIGKLWASGAVTVATEHRFSALVGDLLAQIRIDSHGDARPVSPQLMLINAEENYHTLGLQIGEVYFMACDIPTLTVVPGLPIKEVMDLLDLHKPKAVGFSVALAPQMKQVWEVAERMQGLPDPPKHLLVGGAAVRKGLDSERSLWIHVCRQLTDVPPLLGESGPTRLVFAQERVSLESV